MDFSILWRFLTDDCEGGKKTTAISIKICATVLCLGTLGMIYVVPTVWQTYTSLTATLERIDRTLELALVRSATLNTAQDVAIMSLRTDTDSNARQINTLRSDLRHLDDTTIKLRR